jgi:hypothetical protein
MLAAYFLARSLRKRTPRTYRSVRWGTTKPSACQPRVFGVRRVLSVREVPAALTRPCACPSRREAGVPGCWPASAAAAAVGEYCPSLPGCAGEAAARCPGCRLSRCRACRAVARRVRAGDSGTACMTTAGTGGNAEPRTATRSCPAHRAVGVARALQGTSLRCASSAPQNSRKSGSTAWFPTESPRTKRHSPAHGGTNANMALPPLIGLYAGAQG